MKAIYKLDWDANRGYQALGVFVAEESEVAGIMGKEIYFGEICGKHSDVALVMTDDILKKVTDDQEFILKFVEMFGIVIGLNPLEYYDELPDTHLDSV